MRGHDLLQPPSVHNQRDIQSVVSANTPLVRGGYCNAGVDSDIQSVVSANTPLVRGGYCVSQGWILCIHLVCVKQSTLSGANIPMQTLQSYTPV